MDLISQKILQPGYHLSFEFFPPKTDSTLESLYDVIMKLKVHNPDFCSVTWGAGGSTIRGSLEVVSTIQNKLGVTSMAHFTGLGMTKETVDEMLERFIENGINNVLVLRGDIPHQMDRETAFKGGFKYASELVGYIRSKEQYSSEKLSILVAGCPEGHPEATSKDDDMKHLVHKVRQGAEGIVTQFFFDNTSFYNFHETLRNHGITAPISVGVMIITKAKMIKKMLELSSNCTVPKTISDAISKYSNDDASMEAFGIDFATKQVADLIDQGHKHFHFYTLNRCNPTHRVLANLPQLRNV